MPLKGLLLFLAGGDRRSIGRANKVARMVANDQRLFPQLIAGLWSEEAVIRMRAADATEKVTRITPQILDVYKEELLALLAETTDKGLRWHLAVIVPRLALNAKERQRAAALLRLYLKDPSALVKTFALEGLADLSINDASLRRQVLELLRRSVREGTAAMKARSRKLLAHLEAG